MKKPITILLVLILLLLNSIIFITDPVSAGPETQSGITRENIIKLAKGAAALYLLSRLNNLIADQRQNEQNQKKETDTTPSRNVLTDINKKIIVIDPGHGGYDPGAVGPGGLEEKVVNLDIALKLYNILKQNTDARIYLTRDDDRFIPLAERTDRANKLNADIFISIHSNADEAGRDQGIETYAHYSTPENTWALAWYLQESLVNELKLKDRGLKANSFHVIRETVNMKSILLEIGYISHHEEEALLQSNKFREKAAEAIYNGLLNYYSTL